MTGLSGRRSGERCDFHDLTCVARTSLLILAVMALSSAGCLVTDSPTFKQPVELPPILTNLNPPASRILKIPRKPGSPNEYVQETIRFDVRSDDLQGPLYGAAGVDFPQSKPFILAWKAILGTGTLGTPRPAACQLAIPSYVEPGCHSISILLSHQGTILGGGIEGDAGSVEGDLGIATWWAQIGIDEAPYQACEPDPVPGDAGADARTDGGAP